MKTFQFKISDQIASFESYMDLYLKNKSTDCIIYSEDGSKFKVHKELFGQTDFLREILSSTKEHCCGTIEVICPCSKGELSHLVNFLYDGEIHCEKESDALKIIDNLQKIFDFPRNLDLIYPNEAFFTSDNSDVQEIVIIPVKEEPFVQGKDIYTDQGENDNEFDSHESENDLQVEHSKCYNENDNLGNTTAEAITVTEEVLENIPNNSDPLDIVIIPPRSKDVSDDLVAIDQGKEDEGDGKVSEKKKTPKKISCKKVKGSSMKTYSQKFNCNDCGGSFRDKGHLKRHINAVHLKLKPYECDQCKIAFAQKYDLQRHVDLVHLKMRPFMCDQCKKTFAEKRYFNQHMMEKCEKMKKNRYRCKDCDASFKTRHYLKHHVNRVHLKIKPLKKLICNECGASFEQKQHLEHHLNKVHLNVRPYKCNQCEKTYFIEEGLKRHLKWKSHGEAAK